MSVATAQPVKPVNWADDDAEEGSASNTPRIETRDEGNGVHVVTEYRTNADDKPVKVTRRIKRTLISTRVNHDMAERKGWTKFGLEKNSSSGPNAGTTSIGANVQIKLNAGGNKEPEQDPTEAMREKLANKRVQCRLCKGDHYTARCPYRDTLEAIPGAGSENPDAESAAAAAIAQVGGEVPAAAKINSVASALGGGKYKPPSLRSGAVPMSMGGPTQRDDSSTLRVTNLSDDVEEEDLRDLFRRYGRVTRIYLGRDRETGACKGFAYVNFEDRASADLARQKLDGFPYSNLILSCQWSQPRADRPT
ncbi:translation initiation factor eIF3 subunit g [Malassezia vespertilionis]|uniref:Eukaryotic translation initiation factor 3 subunit G n=1 Tax=Malassezia vespertilionis TaxID=2020962 RepID=A0A2N1JCL9_9BASI|nr:translation initiation factor eIF3 subunit g [Malassezia vespertilionis]PKI84289.1 Tif35p [Malassezia vespertilionis]WFD06392.1 translation initiation factor eIF3 subunit g [Malassezia vespertilionis]